jgi:hypothetical protein
MTHKFIIHLPFTLIVGFSFFFLFSFLDFFFRKKIKVIFIIGRKTLTIFEFQVNIDVINNLREH